VPPYRETHAYVAKVIKDFNRTKLAQRAAAKQNTQAATKTQKKAAPEAKSQKQTASVAN
jgi:hypothetical protein